MKKLFTLAAFILLSGITHAQSWQSLATTPINKIARSAAFSIGTKGYLLAGDNYSETAYSYDAVADSWTTINNYPIPNTDGAVGCSLNGIGYVGTGVQYSTRTNAFFSYDPISGNWTTLPNFPGAVRAYAVAFALDGKVYLGGGLDGSTTGYNDFYTYDPSKGAWDATPIKPCPALGVSCDAVAFVIGDKVYVGSGGIITTGQSVPQKDFWEYDTITKDWTRIADLPGRARAEANAFSTCDKGFVGLGYINVNRDTLVADFWEYNPAQDKWTQIADYGGIGRSSAFSFTIGKTGYVCAGLGGLSGSIELHDLWSYTPLAKVAFTTAGSSSTSICAGQSVSYTDTSNFGPTNWQWTFKGGTPGTSTDQNPTIRYDTAGVYDVTLSAWNSCDTGSQKFTQYITVGSGGTLTVTANPSFVCSGQPSVLSIASASGTYQWSPAAGLTDSTSASITVNPITTTTYTVSQAGGVNCASKGQVTVMVGNNTIAGISTAVRDTICAGSSGNLSLAGNSSSAIQWQSSLNDSTFTNSAHDTLASYKTNPLKQTTFYRAIVGTGNCSATSDTVTLYVPPALIASFYIKSSSGSTLNFNSDSSQGKIRSYHWDFGDDSISTLQNPSHTYTNKDSTYYVCLTLYDGSNCSYTFCRYSTVTVTSGSGVPTVSAAGNWIVYPNPFSEQLTVSSKQTNNHIQGIEMYDVLGQLVINKDLANATTTSLQLDVSSLAKGMYYVMIRTADADYVQKVVKQ